MMHQELTLKLKYLPVIMNTQVYFIQNKVVLLQARQKRSTPPNISIDTLSLPAFLTCHIFQFPDCRCHICRGTS